MDIFYKVFVEDKLVQSFKGSSWYDTATPFQWCVSELKKIADKIKSGQEVRIISEESELQILNLTDFKNWLINEFKGGFDEYI